MKKLIEQYIIPGIVGKMNIYETDKKTYKIDITSTLVSTNQAGDIFEGCKTRDCARRVLECFLAHTYTLELAHKEIYYPNKAGWIKQFQIFPTKKKNTNKIK